MSEQSEYEEKLHLYEREVETVKAVHQYIEFLNETKRSTSDNLYKLILTFSGLALTLSVPVLEKVDRFQMLVLLQFAWVFLALSIVVIMAGHLLESKHLDATLLQVVQRQPYTDLETQPLSERISPLRVACITFSFALLSLVVFLVVNVGGP